MASSPDSVCYSMPRLSCSRPSRCQSAIHTFLCCSQPRPICTGLSSISRLCPPNLLCDAQLRWRMLLRLWPLLAVPAAFATFAVANGGIVVGDREAHAPARHLAQPLYFAAFAAAALAPALLSPAALLQGLQRGTEPQLRRLPLAAAAAAPVALALAMTAIDRGTVVHPYLLADNRFGNAEKARCNCQMYRERPGRTSMFRCVDAEWLSSCCQS